MGRLSVDEMVQYSKLYDKGVANTMTTDDIVNFVHLYDKLHDIPEKPSQKTALPQAKGSPTSLNAITNSGVTNTLLKLGKYIDDAVATATADSADALLNIMAPSMGLPKGTEQIARSAIKDQQDYFTEQYGDSKSAMGFKDALSSIALGSATPEIKLSDFAASTLDKLPKLAAKIADFTTAKTSQGAIIGAESDDSDNKLASVAKGAKNNLELAGAFKGAGKAIGAATGLSGEKILENLEATGDMPATGSEILEAPFLKSAQKNRWAYVPGTGQMTQSKKIYSYLSNKANDIYSSLLGNTDHKEILSVVQSGSLGRYHDAYAKIGKQYDKVVDYLEKNGFSLGNNTMRVRAKKLLSSHNKAVAQAPILKDPELETDLASYAGMKPYGRMRPADYQVAKAEKSKLFQKMQDSEDRYTRGIYAQLYDAANKDLKLVGDKTSKKMARDADQQFKETIAPYKEKELSKWVSGKHTPKQMVNQFIKSAKAEDADKLDILSGILTPEEKSLMGAELFKTARNEDGTMNFTKMANIWSSMGSATKDTFFNKSQQSALNQLVKQRKMALTALDVLVNPNTGQAVERGKGMDTFLHAYGTVLGALIGHFNIGAAAAALSPLAGTGIFQKALNNKSVLEFIAKRKMGVPTQAAQIVPAFTAAMQKGN